MLESLNIRNLAIIEDLTIDFRSGLNVLSGETGAGKSIIIGALGLVLGEKASSSMVRSGAEMAAVEGLFDVSGNREASAFLQAEGLPEEQGEVVVKRVISAEGKSRAFINGSLTNQAVLKAFGSLLVDIHGQHEHQSLLRVQEHIRMLDSFGENKERVQAIARGVARMRALREQLGALDMDEQEKSRKQEFNDFAIREIDAAALKSGEEDALNEEATILNNFEKIHTALDRAWQDLQSSGALGLVRDAAVQFESVSDHDPQAASFHSRCQDLLYNLEDLNDELRGYRQGIEFSPERLEEVNSRLALIQGLKRKYGSCVDEVLEYRERCFQENESISSSGQRKKELEEELARLSEEMRTLCFELSSRRQSQGRDLEERIMAELQFLGMEKTSITVDVKYIRDEYGPFESSGERIRLFDNGIDYVEFLISPNPGELPRPLRKIASGGEMSRVMLALKTVLTSGTACDTLVFDEVDAGIGGVTASAVGKKLQQVACDNQVLCITHLPQIAAMAGHHIMVRKSVEGGRTRSMVQLLTFEKRLEELARMIGGEAVSETTLDQAREMIEKGQGRR